MRWGHPLKDVCQEFFGSQDIRFEGRWTDDTHMMIGVAESLITKKGFFSDHMAQTFMSNWEKQPWRGYGPGPPRVFKMMKSEIPCQDVAKQLYGGTGSFGNGAAMMRAHPAKKDHKSIFFTHAICSAFSQKELRNKRY